MQLGVCYFPEHWPEGTWHTDAKRMKNMGLSWVRVGEFAWGKLEPSPGELHFDWLDRAADTLGDAGLKVVLCTPTATPPKWLVDKYDDILQVGADGHLRTFGSRRHYCFNSSSYQIETKRIVTLLAERYGQHEAVQAWQTDNEYGCHDTVRCYCPNCAASFREWLRTKYGDIDALNEAWWNRFWSMEYRDFAEIDPPNLTVTEPNPSHSLDYYRFASSSVVSYNRLQAGILKTHSDKPVTHNVMLYFGDFDHFKLAEDLDTVTWDSYPLGMLELSPLPNETKAHYLRTGHPDLISFMHDLYFGLKDKPFWVMEQQPGQVNWAPSNPLPAKGAVALWTQQAFAHGADVVAYFRWRSALGAQELMHAGLNKHDGSPDRAVPEVREVAESLRGLDAKGERSAEVTLLFDYENLWATNLQPHAEGWDYWALLLNYYSVLRSLGLNIAVTHPRSDLAPYKLVIALALHLVDNALVNHLTDYVSEGGQLVLGPRSGVKTLSNTVHEVSPLDGLRGASRSHVDALRPGIHERVRLEGERLSYSIWADILEPSTATTLATYETAAYAGRAAVIRNLLGQGSCLSIGMWAEPETLAAILLPLLAELNIQTEPQPEGVRITRRGNLRYQFNFNDEAIEVAGGLLEPCGVNIAGE